MPKKRKGKDAAPGRAKVKAPPDYYLPSESDAAYVVKARQRTRNKVLRQWLVRLVVVGVLLLAWHFWGPTVIRMIRGESLETLDTLKGAGRALQEGRDRRSGVGLDENP